MTVFDIAKKNDVVIVVEPLANIYAYYNKIENQKFIHINDCLTDHSIVYLVGHMLYFALHKNDEIHLLSKDFNGEKAASKFAFELLKIEENLSDDDKKKLCKKLNGFWKMDIQEQLEQS